MTFKITLFDQKEDQYGRHSVKLLYFRVVIEDVLNGGEVTISSGSVATPLLVWVVQESPLQRYLALVQVLDTLPGESLMLYIRFC